MTQNQIRGGQIRSGTIANEQIASNAQIALSKIAGGTDLSNRVSNLEDDAVVTREVPSGSVNGSNTTFTLANTPVAGSEQVYLNGLLQDPGQGNSYTISGAVITFLSAPISGDEIHVTYATGNYMVAPGGSGAGFTYTDSSVFTWPGNTSGNPTVQTYTHNHGAFPDKIEVLVESASGGWVPAPSVHAGGSSWYGCFVGDSSQNTVSVNFYGNLFNTTNTKIRCTWFE